MKLDITKVRNLLQEFDFKAIFIEELGWSQPAQSKATPFVCGGIEYEIRQIAQLAGVVIFEIIQKGGKIPDAKERAAVYKDIARHHHENLLIFIDSIRSQSIWYWVKRENKKIYPRDHVYVKGQPGDLFLSKLGTMVVDISELDETGNIPVTEAAGRLRDALDIERVTKKFFREFSDEHIHFIDLIEGIDNERDRRWYASILLNRLMFIYFLQQKYFLDNGSINYLQDKLTEVRQAFGIDKYFSRFLKTLFFEGFAKPENERSNDAGRLLGNIRYLNGGLFLPHRIESVYKNIHIPDKAFENILKLFGSYSWNLNDIPGGRDDEINPDVLGYIFEKYINQKAFGAYYTRPEITEYLCEHTIYKLILDKINNHGIPGVLKPRRFDSIAELLLSLDAGLCRELLMNSLPSLSLLDPACGSGAFLVAAMKTLINLYSAIIGKIEFVNDRNLTEWLRKAKAEHKSLAYFIKKRIITDNLFGVDIMEEATEIAKLRLFLALVASARSVDELEPLPNIDFNILAGNSLIGLMHVNDRDFNNRTSQGDLFRKSYREVLSEKNRLIDDYRHTASYAPDLRALRDNIEKKKTEARDTLNEILLDEFTGIGIKFEEAVWDTAKNKEGKPRKRKLMIKDIEALTPFHWGYEFDEIINKRGGFDAIITNPPWEIFKPQAKEFFAEHSGLVTKNKMTIKEFEKEQTKLMKNAEIRDTWIEYQSRFPHVSQYFRSSNQYKNQIAIIAGKKAGTDINLYKLFVEQCYNLLRPDGECGIVIPSGIYTDLGTKQLREMLFNQTEVTGLFCFENRKEIFEGVHRSFKFIVLTFAKGGSTDKFPAAFMRHEVSELARFPKEGALDIPIELIRRLSPDSLSVMEFKNDMDIHIAEKMLKFPLLGEKIEGTWNLSLTREFDMTNDSHLFKTEPGPGRLPLYEGKMIWQFDHKLSDTRYWIPEAVGKEQLDSNNNSRLDYEQYRLAFRDVTGNTNERTLVSAIIPPKVFCGNTLPTVTEPYSLLLRVFLTSVFNSFVIDWMIRQKITNHCNFFYMMQLPIPRLTENTSAFHSKVSVAHPPPNPLPSREGESSWAFQPIVERAARLICTTPEFDDMAKEAGISSHKNGVTNEIERNRLRAELDGLIAHLYELTEEEFTYILTTFPLVPEPVKTAALNAYRDVERGMIV